MESLGVITEVEEPTAWCSGMVAVPKKSGQVQICIDFHGATVFSKLDANCGFWQIPVANDSSHPTTFVHLLVDIVSLSCPLLLVVHLNTSETYE